jgi:hypothetical protein
VQHQVPVLAGVEQPLRGLPQLRRVAAPQPVRERQVPLDVAADAARRRGGVVGGQQRPPVPGAGRVKAAQVDAGVPALEHREREGAPGQRLQVAVRQQPPDQRVVQAELGRVAVGLRERGHRVEHRLEGLGDRGLGQPAAPPRPAHPRRQHVRHGILLRVRQHHLARQPAEQERPHLGRAHPQRAAEVLVAAVVDDAVGAVRGRPQVRQVLRLVGGQELGGQHRPAVPAPHLAARAGAGRRAAALRRQRPDPRPDERVVGGERVADRRVVGRVGDGERGLQHVPGLPGVDLPERVLAHGAALAARLPAVVEQLGHPRGHPAVAHHPVRVVVHHGDQRVRLLAVVAEHADHLVLVAEGIRVDVAVPGGHRAQVLRPAGARHAAFDQLQGGPLGPGRLPRRAEAGDAGQQRQRRRAALGRRVLHEALADKLLDGDAAAAAAGAAGPAVPPRPALPPPGAEQLADHQLGVERAAHGQQFAGGAEHLREQRAGRRGGAVPLAAIGATLPSRGHGAAALAACGVGP